MDDLISRQAAIEALDGNVRVMGMETVQAVMEYIRECAGRIRSLPSAQAEPTFEQVKEYCDRRCLTIITNDLYHDLITAYLTRTERKTGRITYTHHSEELWGQSAICISCGCKWQIAEEGEDNFCPNCGKRMVNEDERSN